MMSEPRVALGRSCKICGNDATQWGDDLIPVFRCPRCGGYQYHAAAPDGWLEVKTPEHMVKLSGWVRAQNDAGIEFPTITMETSRRVATMPFPRRRERAYRALVTMERMPDRFFDPQMLFNNLELQARTYT
jgi:hypothetical protein